MGEVGVVVDESEDSKHKGGEDEENEEEKERQVPEGATSVEEGNGRVLYEWPLVRVGPLISVKLIIAGRWWEWMMAVRI